MAGEVLVDALPYTDSGYDESGVKQAVRSSQRLRLKFFNLNQKSLKQKGSGFGGRRMPTL